MFLSDKFFGSESIFKSDKFSKLKILFIIRKKTIAAKGEKQKYIFKIISLINLVFHIEIIINNKNNTKKINKLFIIK